MLITYKPSNLPEELTDAEYADLCDGLVTTGYITNYDTTNRTMSSDLSPEEQFNEGLYQILALAARVWDLQNPSAANDDVTPSEPSVILPFTR